MVEEEPVKDRSSAADIPKAKRLIVKKELLIEENKGLLL